MPLARFNPDAQPHLIRLGREQSPVVLIDDALLNPDDLVDHAATQALFQSAQATLYPGLNAELSPHVASGIVMPLQALIRDTFAVDFKNAAFSGYYGLVTAAPADLSRRQAIPHYDVSERPHALAVLLYLCDNDMGGTGFYRHRATGFETIGPTRAPTYLASVESELARHAGIPAYFDDSDADFERIGKVEAEYNRLIIYDGSLLHSALVVPEKLSADPRQGRLTANIFVKV